MLCKFWLYNQLTRLCPDAMLHWVSISALPLRCLMIDHKSKIQSVILTRKRRLRLSSFFEMVSWRTIQVFTVQVGRLVEPILQGLLSWHTANYWGGIRPSYKCAEAVAIFAFSNTPFICSSDFNFVECIPCVKSPLTYQSLHFHQYSFVPSTSKWDTLATHSLY